jgi:NTP pyrophosphatase (non-canonical NTP hydrolase)
MDIPAWQARLQRFSAARGWEPFQNPKNLVMALSVEAAELVECYQWLTPEQAAAPSPDQRQAVADEIGDVLIYLLQLARVTGIDLEQAAEQKLAKTALKYPAP